MAVVKRTEKELYDEATRFMDMPRNYPPSDPEVRKVYDERMAVRDAQRAANRVLWEEKRCEEKKIRDAEQKIIDAQRAEILQGSTGFFAEYSALVQKYRIQVDRVGGCGCWDGDLKMCALLPEEDAEMPE